MLYLPYRSLCRPVECSPTPKMLGENPQNHRLCDFRPTPGAPDSPEPKERPPAPRQRQPGGQHKPQAPRKHPRLRNLYPRPARDSKPPWSVDRKDCFLVRKRESTRASSRPQHCVTRKFRIRQ